MKPVDAIGNTLEKGDLVIQTDAQGTTFFCLITEIKEPSTLATSKMEMMGSLTMVPVPLTLNYSAQNPRLTTIAKCVKPAHFNKEPS